MSQNSKLKFKHFETQAAFDEQLQSNAILDSDLCFIKESKKIYTHGMFYNCNSTENVSFDIELSDTSENAVQNKVITESLEKYIILSRDFSDDFNNDFAR